MTKKLLTILLLFGLLLTVQAPVTWAQEGEETGQDEVAQETPTPTPELTEEALQEEEPTEEVIEEPTEEPIPEGVEEVPTDAVEVSIGGADDAGDIGEAGYPAGQHFNSSVYIQNTTTGDLNYQITLYNVSSGSATTCSDAACDGTIKGNSGTEILFGNMSSLADGRYAAIIDSDAQAVAVVNTWSEKYGMGYSSRPAGNRVYFPNVNRNHAAAKWTTMVYVQNAGTSAVNDFYLDFYNLDTAVLERTYGPYSINAGRSLEVDPTTLSPALATTYYAVVGRTASGDDSLVGVASQMSSNVVQAMSYSAFSSGATELYLPNIQSYYAKAKWFTPIIIQNLSSSTQATVQITYYRFGSTTAAWTSGELSIPANAGLVERIWDRVTGGTGLQNNVQYSVKVTSLDKGSGAMPIAAVVNQVSNPQNQAMAYTSVSEVGSTVYVPYATKYYGTAKWFTPVIVQNVGDSSTTVTVNYYAQDSTGVATIAGTETLTLGAPGVANASRPWDIAALQTTKKYVAQILASDSQDVIAVVNVCSSTYLSQDYAISWEGIAP